MSDIKWIKIDTGLFSNRKVRQIERMDNGDSLIILWIKLLILAAEVNDNGYLLFTKDVPYDAELMATQMDRDKNEIQRALDLFVKYDMVEVETVDGNTVYCISNWEKYQNASGMERIREQNRIRKQRERKRDTEEDSHAVTSRDSHATDKEEDKDKDKDKEKDKEEVKPKKRVLFTPPTVDEVKAYCLERNNKIDAQTFIDFYEAKGWMIGTNKMKDWKAAVRTWEKRNNGKTTNNSSDKKGISNGYMQNDYDFKSLESQLLNRQKVNDKRYTV